MVRNDKTKPLVSNGKRRPGQMKWHDENCQIEDYGISEVGRPIHTIWCATHGQWAHETPVKVTYTFEDGTEVVKPF